MTEELLHRAMNSGPSDYAEFEIIEDPIPVEAGGFRPSAKFSKKAMVQMLEDKVLANYTLVKHIPTGEIYHIKYGGWK